MSRSVPVKDLILVPVVISLVVTLVRLVGELMGGPSILFNREAGGGGALVGISWLVPVFGAYFAWKLIGQGYLSTGAGKTAGIALLGLLAMIVFGVIGGLLFETTSMPNLVMITIGSVVAIWICKRGWAELYQVLLGYALAVRIPVAILMLIAMIGNWGTHYDVPPPGFPEMNLFFKWIVIGLIPQLTVWVAFTLVVGALFGALVILIRGGKQAASA